MRHFAARWDAALRLSTILGSVAMLGAALVTAWLPSLSRGTAPPALRAAGLVTLGVLVACWVLAPSAYAIIAGELRIQRRGARPIAIPLATIIEVSLVDELGPVVRVMGAGGLFGYFGRYRSRALGSVRMYATRRRDFVLVRTDAAVWLLTPEPRRAFVDALRADAPHVREVAAPTRPARRG